MDRIALLKDIAANPGGGNLSLSEASLVLQCSIAVIRNAVLRLGSYAGRIDNGGTVASVTRTWVMTQLPADEIFRATRQRHGQRLVW